MATPELGSTGNLNIHQPVGFTLGEPQSWSKSGCCIWLWRSASSRSNLRCCGGALTGMPQQRGYMEAPLCKCLPPQASRFTPDSGKMQQASVGTGMRSLNSKSIKQGTVWAAVATEAHRKTSWYRGYWTTRCHTLGHGSRPAATHASLKHNETKKQTQTSTDQSWKILKVYNQGATLPPKHQSNPNNPSDLRQSCLKYIYIYDYICVEWCRLLYKINEHRVI